MRFDQGLTEQQWLQLLREEAERTWGAERVAADQDTLTDLAHAIQRVLNVGVGAQEEPYLLDARPLTLEDL
jgi:hypothetical protein